MMPSAQFPDLKGASVLITGGGSGIGAALTEGFVRQGCKVAFIDIADEPSRELCDRLEKSAGNRPLLPERRPARHRGTARSGRAKPPRRMGPRPCSSTTRHMTSAMTSKDVTVDFWDENQAINLRPQFFAVQAVAPEMIKAGKGSIINFTSTSFMMNNPDMPSYTAAKAGVIGLTKGLAGKLGHDGIRVNAVAPGWVITERQQKLWVTPEALKAHVDKQSIRRGHAAGRPRRSMPVPRFGRCRHGERADADRRRGLFLSEAALAAVDWGTSSFRLWLLDAKGAVLAERRGPEGMLVAGTEGFSAILERYLADAGAAADLRVIVCGMAGARQGWVEAPYVSVPAGIDAILAGAVAAPAAGRDVRILPGLAQRQADAPDVMRGEETQLAGILPLFSQGRHLICMPGTHSKWVEAEDGVIQSFRTWLTGELFSLMSTHSILRHSLDGAPRAAAHDDPGFRQRLRPRPGRRRRCRLRPVPHPCRHPAPGPAARRCRRHIVRPADRC